MSLDQKLRAELSARGTPKALRVHDVATAIRNAIQVQFPPNGERGTFAGPGDEASEFQITANGHTYNIIVQEIE